MIGSYLDLARAHAPMLTLAILLCGAALAAIASQRRLSWIVALAAASGATIVTGAIGWRVLVSGAPLPLATIGIGLSIDGVGAFAAPCIAALTALALLAAARLNHLPERVEPHAMALSLAAAAGWIGALFVRDLFALIVTAQIGWLASAALVGLSRERGGLNGAMRMWAAGGAGAAMMLLGLAFVVRAVGSAEVSAVASEIVAAPRMATVGYVLVLTPLALAAGLAPLHFWVGAVYGRANDLAALIVGTTTTIGALAVLTRLAAYVASAPAIAEGLAAALVALGATSVVIGAVQSVGAVNIRRLIAYAGASQGGCAILAMALGSPAGFAAALIQLFAWAAAALALLGGAAAAAQGTHLSALDGLSRRAPVATVAITAGALSLMGAPLTLGFLGRWRLIEASVGAGWWWATGAAVIASLSAVFYGGRLIERMYFRRVTQTAAVDRDVWRYARAPVVLLAIVVIALGAAPNLLLQAAERAAALVLGHAT